jgi:hypothetical protein
MIKHLKLKTSGIEVIVEVLNDNVKIMDEYVFGYYCRLLRFKKGTGEWISYDMEEQYRYIPSKNIFSEMNVMRIDKSSNELPNGYMYV